MVKPGALREMPQRRSHDTHGQTSTSRPEAALAESDGKAPRPVAAAIGPRPVFGYPPRMQLDWSDLRGAVAAGCLLISSVPAAAQVAAPPQQGAPQPAPPPPSVAAVAAPSDPFAIPATDDGLPGTGPIRRMEWFQNLWKQRRTVWSTQVQRDQGAVVFLGDSITQGWGLGLGAVFPGVKVANRGISGDTTRGVLIRLKEDVLDLNPRAVVILIGTNDLEEKATPETIDSDFRLLIATLKAHNPKMPIVACLVMPSSVSMRRPAEDIKKINALRMASIKGDPQVIPLDTWTLFADKTGEPVKDEFPDVLHPNDYGYIKFAAALRPIFATLGFTETEPDYFTPEPGFESLFNGKDLTGWGLRPTSEADKESAKKWQASDPNAATWPFVTEAAVVRRQDVEPRRPLPGHQRPARRHHAARAAPHPADLDEARVPEGLRAQARVPRHAERRQRRLPARPAAAVPRLRARRSVHEPHEVQAAGLERDDRDGAERRGDGDRERREARRRAEGAADRPDRPRRRSRTDGVPPHPDQDREVAPGHSYGSAPLMLVPGAHEKVAKKSF